MNDRMKKNPPVVTNADHIIMHKLLQPQSDNGTENIIFPLLAAVPAATTRPHTLFIVINAITPIFSLPFK